MMFTTTGLDIAKYIYILFAALKRSLLTHVFKFSAVQRSTLVLFVQLPS